MFSRKLLWGFAFIFIFLSVVALLTNMPESKNMRVYKALLPYFPYKIEKEFGGLDIVDKRTGEDLDVANAQVYIVYDELLKKWGKNHLKLEGDTLYILDEKGKNLSSLQLQNEKERRWVEEFFNLKGRLDTR
ncbi:MAG: hypothetical protein GXO19_01365 [Epsilonproteobacteria bacterium]|nr:hypothetical protein [Campylobacterota bacterium]NPA56363.1 hypothetical protein [Campylobacterota bacterium]